jgi:hypothetical protein
MTALEEEEVLRVMQVNLFTQEGLVDPIPKLQTLILIP